MIRAVSNKSWLIRHAALEAIAKRGDPSLVEKIEAAMSDDKNHVRFTAAAAVIRLTDIGGDAEGKEIDLARPSPVFERGNDFSLCAVGGFFGDYPVDTYRTKNPGRALGLLVFIEYFRFMFVAGFFLKAALVDKTALIEVCLVFQ